MIEIMAKMKNVTVEVNDASALFHLSGMPHTIGSFMNVYNEDSMSFLAKNGAEHVCLPPELPWKSLEIMAKKAAALNISTEVQI